jgi:hypothetical protein
MQSGIGGCNQKATFRAIRNVAYDDSNELPSASLFHNQNDHTA